MTLMKGNLAEGHQIKRRSFCGEGAGELVKGNQVWNPLFAEDGQGRNREWTM